MAHKIHDTGVARHLGFSVDAIETTSGLRWLHTSGTPGITDSGELPEGIEAQSRLAWAGIFKALSSAGMTAADLIKVTTTLVDAADLPLSVKIRKEVLGEARPALMSQVVNQLIRPGILVEVEAIAARQ